MRYEKLCPNCKNKTFRLEEMLNTHNWGERSRAIIFRVICDNIECNRIIFAFSLTRENYELEKEKNE